MYYVEKKGNRKTEVEKEDVEKRDFKKVSIRDLKNVEKRLLN